MTHFCLQRLSLWWMVLLYPITIPSSSTSSPAYSELFLNILTWIFYNLFSLLFCLVADIKIKICTIKLVSENIGNIFFYFCQFNEGSRDLANQILDFFFFFWKWLYYSLHSNVRHNTEEKICCYFRFIATCPPLAGISLPFFFFYRYFTCR